MQPTQQKYTSVLISLILLFTISACSSSNATPSANAVPSTIVISLGSEPEYREVHLEVIPQNNCGGNAEVESEIQRSRSIAHTIEVGAGFQVNANGQVGFAGTDIELGATVANELGYSYGTEDTLSRSITVKAKEKTYVEHHIKLQEVWKIGTAKVIVGGKETRIPFYFRTDFALDLAESKELKDKCGIEPVASNTPEPINVTDTPRPIPINTPVSPTNTPVPPTLAPIPTSTPRTDILPNGEVVSPESLAKLIGGNPAYWTKQGSSVWRYWDKGHNATFRHPGGNTILTYWEGFPPPRNANGCIIESTVFNGGPTRTVQCTTAGAEFEADGVGFHLVD